MQHEESGQLTIRPLCAIFVEDIHQSGRDNPYVEIKFGGRTYTSTVATNQGGNPAWVDKVDCILTKETTFELCAYDNEFRNKGDYNGSAIVHLARFKKARNHIEWLDIAKDGMRTGKVKIAFEFVPDNTPVVSG